MSNSTAEDAAGEVRPSGRRVVCLVVVARAHISAYLRDRDAH